MLYRACQGGEWVPQLGKADDALSRTPVGRHEYSKADRMITAINQSRNPGTLEPRSRADTGVDLELPRP